MTSAALVLLAAAFGLLVGGSGMVLTVASGSMAPTLQPGDIVLARYVPASRVTVGQIVTFSDHSRGALVTHRVAEVRDTGGGRRQFVTRGDVNSGTEMWSVDRDDRIRLMTARIPLPGGPQTARAVTKGSTIALFVVVITIMGATAVRKARRPLGGAKGSDAGGT